ncbi:AAA family ATPase [bacterium]|nr:AAA family ATPase [bacterium]
MSRFRLRRFMRFDEFDVLLRPGLNLLVGPNESGKSTIVEALGVALFVDPTTKSKAIRSLEAWGSSGGMELELDFEHDGSEYRLVKHFGEGRSELSGGGEQTSDRAAVMRRIAEMVGFGSREAFESVAMVRQGELAAFEGQFGKNRRAELVPMIERKMTSSSGRVDAAAVLDAIARQISTIRVGMDHPAKNSGVLKRLSDERAHLRTAVADVGQRWGIVLSRRAAHAHRRQEWTDIKEEGERLARIIQEQEVRLSVSGELEGVEGELNRVESTIARVRKLRSDHADALGEKDSIPEVEAERVKSANGELRVTERLISDCEAESKVPVGARSSHTAVMTIVTGALAGFGVASLLFVLDGLIPQVVAGVATVALGVWAVTLFRKFGVQREHERDLGNLMRERGKRELALQAALMQIGVPSFGEFARLYGDQDKRWQRAEIARAQLAEVCDSEEPEMFEQGLQTRAVTLGRRRGELSSALGNDSVAQTALSPEEVAKLRDELNVKRERESDLHDVLARDEVRLERDEEGESLPELEARLEAVEGEMTAVEQRLAVMRRASDGLERALASTKEEAAEVLAPIVTEMLSTITAGRYSRVTVSRDLEVAVDNPCTRRGAPANVLQGDLSSGTVDQLYLATRYALLKFLSDSEGAPFILDDVFVNCDPDRRMRALELLREISDHRQVIACMCEDHGAEDPVNLIRLAPV